MNTQQEPFEYDDSEAVVYIRKHISPELAQKLSNDDITYVVDVIWEYYDSRGFLDEEEDEVELSLEIDLDEVATYIQKAARKDGVATLTLDEVLQIVEAEMDYSDFDEVTEEA